MSYNYKYSTLGQRERLKRIRNGDSDVYQAEKELNGKQRRALAEAGVSTADIDEWDATIDNAYKSSGEKAKNAAIPKFGSSRLGAINKALSTSIKDLKKQKNESIESAKTEAEDALEFIEEWLAANGYYKDGNLATKSKKEIEDALEAALESIKRDYDKKLGNTRSKYLSMAQ